MTYEPTEAEIKAFQVIISRELYEEPSQYMAQVILRHYEPRTREQQSAVTPPVAPITSGILNTLVEQAAVEQKAWRLGYEQGRREGEARGKRTIALDERTLRGLMAAILTLNEWSYSPNAADAADVILAEIDKAKEESK